MNSREIAAEIKMRVSMRDICARYGLSVNGAGFINCPFHAGDNTASLKIYRGNKGWHCFGCSAGGSVIDFVMMYFNIDFKQAVIRLDSDFDLKLPLSRKLTPKERINESTRLREMQAKNKAYEDERQRLEADYWQAFDEWKYLDDLIIAYKPERRKIQPLHPLYEYALSKIAVAEYNLDYAEWRLKEYGKQTYSAVH